MEMEHGKEFKCDTCDVMRRVEKSRAAGEYACCRWYMENVVILDKSVDECTMYEPIKS